MLVTFVSQCRKNALKKTRRVLDSFANRIGDKTWQTVITQDGLDAVRKLLRQTASKNTAVACHWMRSRSRSEVIWLVGNKARFNGQGYVPVNWTQVNRAQMDDIASWQYLPLIQALASLAALLHDWGKANKQFQNKLIKHSGKPMADALRHEWVSCLLLKAFVQSASNDHSLDDHTWLTALASGDLNEEAILSALGAEAKPLKDLPLAARLVAWLILTHHRLPALDTREEKGKDAYTLSLICNGDDMSFLQVMDLFDKDWGFANAFENLRPEECLTFEKGLLTKSPLWVKELKRWSRKLLSQEHMLASLEANTQNIRPVLHHARLSLMLGDHYYSSLSREESGVWRSPSGLVANTDRKDRKAKQALDQHLVGVYQQTKRNVRKLPLIETGLPVTQNTKALKKRSPAQYAWQDKAVKAIQRRKRDENERPEGAFIINMASTGTGKTFANAKIMLALSKDNISLRYTLALGLRTLTLQTGDEYKKRIFAKGVHEDLAVVIGSKAIAELHEDSKKDDCEDIEQAYGYSESQESLLDANNEVHYDADIDEAGLATVLPDSKSRQFLYAPVLVCTIDHIIAATETIRGGRYILPSLRLMSSDLVIDEVDDFTGSDLIAISRLIHMTGMLGRKVLISSATIPPALAIGFHRAYCEGWKLFCATRNADPAITTVWVDEFQTSVERLISKPNAEDIGINALHDQFVQTRCKKLAKAIVRRKATIIECEDLRTQYRQALVAGSKKTEDGPLSTLRHGYFTRILETALKLHKMHSWQDEQTGIQVSFGLIRMANINPCVALARFLMEAPIPSSCAIRTMAYHSQQVLLLRHEQEKHLDAVLKRKESQGAAPDALNDPVIRNHLSHCNKKGAKELIMILAATPVEEVGRDHDFDWAVVEPSSFRSIIQLAGRIRRHRNEKTDKENIAILQYNWKAIKAVDPAKPVFMRPGYESGEEFKLGNKKLCAKFKHHDLRQLIDEKDVNNRLDSVPRISSTQSSTHRFAAIEHAVTSHWINDYKQHIPNSSAGYITRHWYLTALPQRYHRFRSAEKRKTVYRFSSGNDQIFIEIDRDNKVIRQDASNEPISALEEVTWLKIEADSLSRERMWLYRDFKSLILDLRYAKDISATIASLRYGELSIRTYDGKSESSFIYSDQLGIFEEEI